MTNEMETFPIDELKFSIGMEDYVINDHIKIHLPTIGEIKAFGEDAYFSVLHMFVRKPYDIAVELDDINVDYQSITDYDLFFDTITAVPVALSRIFFGDLDFTAFEKYVDPYTGLKYLNNRNDTRIVIDEVLYRKLSHYLRYVHFISEKVEYDVGNGMAKRFLLDRMRRKKKKYLKDLASGKEKKQSVIANMIRYCVNCNGFKYDYSTVLDLKINLLYESYYYLNHSFERDKLMSGIYHGMIEANKLKDKTVLNAVPDLHR